MGNGLYLPYQNLGAKSPLWNLNFSILHIWVKNGDFPTRNMETCIFHTKHWCYITTYVPCLPVFPHALKFLCVYPRKVLALVSVFFCVDMLPITADTEMNVTDRKTRSKQKEAPGIHRLGETGPCISEVVLFKRGMRIGWPVTTQDSVFPNLGLHQEILWSSYFLLCWCVCVCVCARKRRWKGWGLIKCKSSGVGLLKRSLCTPQSMRIWADLWKWLQLDPSLSGSKSCI